MTKHVATVLDLIDRSMEDLSDAVADGNKGNVARQIEGIRELAELGIHLVEEDRRKRASKNEKDRARRARKKTSAKKKPAPAKPKASRKASPPVSPASGPWQPASS